MYEISDHDPLLDDKLAIRGTWKSCPAPWLSYKTIGTQAMVLLHSRANYAQPTIARNLTIGMELSTAHTVWKCIANVDVLGLRKLLCTTSVGVNDCGTFDSQADASALRMLADSAICTGPPETWSC